MKRFFFIWVASLLVLTSCVIGDGDIVRQERRVRDFNSISLEDVGDVHIRTGESYKVVVTTDDNLQNYVLTETKNNVLYIKVKSKKRIVRTKFKVDVCLPELHNLNLSGVGDVIIAEGSAAALTISLSGVGDIDARNYRLENVTVKHSGVGDVKIWVTESLSGTLSGVGDIRYKGNPTVNVKVSGVGKVSKL